MAVPNIKMLQEKPLSPYSCDMCKSVTKRAKFLWISWFTKNEITICRDCAYREAYGTKKIKKAKRDKCLERDA